MFKALTKSIFIVSVITGCATQLSAEGEKVRLVSAAQKDGCESLGIVTTDQQLGPNKASNAMNKALNEIVRRGGNAVFVISNGTSGIDGVSVTAEALRCNKS